MRPSVTAAGSALISGVVMFLAGRMTRHPDPSATAQERIVVTDGQTRADQSGTASARDVESGFARQEDSRPPAAEAMEDEIRSILLDPDPIHGLERFSALLRKLTPENAQAAWVALQSQADGRDGMRYLPLLSHAWGSIDGRRAMSALAELGGRESLMGRAGVMGGWAAQDPQAALAWLKEHEAAAKARREEEGGGNAGRRGRGRGDDTRVLRAGMINGLARSDPAAAMTILETMNEAERGQLVSVVAQSELKRGMDHATRWAASISDPAMRKQAVAEVAREFARDDPASAAAWIASSGSGELAASAVGSVAREWVAREPGKAVEWIGTLNDGEAKDEAYQAAFRTWGRRDPTASSMYLAEMPDGPGRDSAISSFVRTVVSEDPGAAIQWADAISDPAARTEALVRTARSWHALDPEAAGEWILNSGLPQDVQQSMQQQPQIRRGEGGARGRGGFEGGRRGGLRSRGGRG